MYVYFGHGIGEKYVTKFDIIIFLLFEKKVETKNIREKIFLPFDAIMN
jgi:hypothetical protein